LAPASSEALRNVRQQDRRVVLILFDIDDAKRSTARLKDAVGYADAIIETVHDPLLVLDSDLRVMRATDAFCTQFRVHLESVEGQLLYELGNRQWDIPALRSLLEEVLPKNSRVNDFKVEHVFPKIGKKKMLLNARRVASSQGGEAVILLSITEA
jgi:two-component system, chemotaxis family, CheB/CheR fusion protein